MTISTKEYIDFVVLWVDGNDPQWQAKKQKYNLRQGEDQSVARYRDWETLKYWFRGVAKFAPWVKTIHFVTDDQIPSWLNTDSPHIHIVSHKDIIPSNALPVFNSNAIEMGILNIENLADKFVLFNDDILLTQTITPEYYFKNGLPVDMAGLTNAKPPKENDIFGNIQKNNYRLLQTQYEKTSVIKTNWKKWLRLSYGKTFIRTMINICRPDLAGLVMPHLSVPYLKRDWERCWERFSDELRQTQFHRFRSTEDVSHFLFRFWRMCEGDFFPERSKGRYFSLTEENLSRIIRAIERQTYPEICINDLWETGDYERAKKRLLDAFETILPEKCEFEI